MICSVYLLHIVTYFRKHNKPPLMGDKNHELKVEHANRSDSQVMY